MKHKKIFRLTGLVLTASLFFSATVSAAALNYQEVWDSVVQENQMMIQRQVQDSKGTGVNILGREDTLYVFSREAVLRETPDDAGTEISPAVYGQKFERTGVCENGWSQGSLEMNGQILEGYIETDALSTEIQIEEIQEEPVKVIQDTDIVDFPARKEGEVIGELLEDDEVERTGVIQEIWSQIRFVDKDKTEITGFVPTAVLDVAQEETETASSDDGTIHKGSGKGVFAQAVNGVTQVDEGTLLSGAMVAEGEPVTVASGAALKGLGTFRITHYCACPICCGVYANGITATGTVCTTNRTIAVNPSQIPYGSQVVINGQVYVAEDCGGAIKDNCIDIYVATHAEGLSKGTYYTEVYLLQ